MKRSGFPLSILSILLVLGTYATSNVAYGGGREHDERKDEEHKEAKKDEHKDVKKKENKEHEEGKEEKKHEGKELEKGVPHAVKLTNLSSMELKDIEIRFSGKDRADFSQTNDCGEELEKRASCTINVTFMPKTPGAKTAVMEVHTSGGNQSVYLTGTGV